MDQFLSVDWNTCLSDPTKIAQAPTLACIPQIIKVLINWSLILATIVALFLVIYTGIKFINSGGDPKSVDSAKKMLTFALIGLIVVFLSFFIINFIATFTRVDALRSIKLGV